MPLVKQELLTVPEHMTYPQKTKKMSKTDPTKKPRVKSGDREG
jgi:hypothetical protein